jgi:hypothetical protein
MIRSPFFFTVLSFIAAGAVAIVVAIITAIAIERRSIEDVKRASGVRRLHLGGGRCRRAAGVPARHRAR